MPGRPVTDQQARAYMQDRLRHSQRVAAARAGFSERTGRRIDADPRLPSQRKPERGRTVPDPLAAVWETMLLPILERKKHGRAKAPRKVSRGLRHSRYISPEIRRRVWARDGGRCTFVGSAGRCAETSLLEFHHIHPFALGGPTDENNITLRCRAHNQYEADILDGSSVARELPDAGWGYARRERADGAVLLRCGSTTSRSGTWA